MSKKIQLIIGSTRENRVGESIASWIEGQLTKNSTVELEIVDLKKQELPAFDAPIPPAYAPTTTEAGKAWAKKVASADGFIFLTPEYNRSIPSSLKNAIDYLAAEWKEKPAVIVSYGYIDGGKSAATHLQDILDWLKIDTTAAAINLHLSQEVMGEDGRVKDIDAAFAQYEEQLSIAMQQLTKEKVPVAENA